MFDNADSLDDKTAPYFGDLQWYLPDAPGVEVIITTRSRTAIRLTELEAVVVAKLAPAEAVDIFVRCCKLREPASDVLEEAVRIVAELDYLALAVTLARAYVAAAPRIRSNISEYLLEYRLRRMTLLRRKAKGERADPSVRTERAQHVGDIVRSDREAVSYGGKAAQLLRLLRPRRYLSRCSVLGLTRL